MSGGDTILVTGFGPFGNHSVNASWAAVQKMVTLHEERRKSDELDTYRIEAREVPVSYSYVKKELEKMYEDISPMICIHVGVSPYTTIKLERCGRNFGYFGRDIHGQVPSNGVCKDDGSEEIRTSINLESVCEMITKVDKSGVEVGISEDAGRYLCDFIYYSSLHLGRCPVVFVHVPPLDDPYSSEQLGQALMTLLEILVIDQRSKNS